MRKICSDNRAQLRHRFQGTVSVQLQRSDCSHHPAGNGMCNLYSITTNQAAIAALFRVVVLTEGRSGHA